MATIRDVAKLAGVGLGTVSRVLSGNGSVSSKTQLKVSQAMATLNFTPNNAARSLVSKKSNTIGIWGTQTSGEMNRRTLTRMEAELKEFGIHLILADGDLNASKDPDASRQSFDRLVNKGCDGIIIWGSSLPAIEILKIENEFPNITLLNNKIELIDDKCFYFDHYKAGYICGQHLINNGHSNIACITGWLETDDGNQRHQGFLSALNDNHVNIPKELIFEGDYTYRKGHEGALHLLKQNHPFTALFCGNDQSAMSAISAITNQGLNVPNDISVMGYDDMNIASYTSPPLSTIQMPFILMAISATRRLLNLCYNSNLEVNYDFPIKLINRKSIQNISTPITLNPKG
jgi:LacI family transcriptional regulator